eukprot:gene1308-1651_t
MTNNNNNKNTSPSSTTSSTPSTTSPTISSPPLITIDHHHNNNRDSVDDLRQQLENTQIAEYYDTEGEVIINEGFDSDYEYEYEEDYEEEEFVEGEYEYDEDYNVDNRNIGNESCDSIEEEGELATTPLSSSRKNSLQPLIVTSPSSPSSTRPYSYTVGAKPADDSLFSPPRHDRSDSTIYHPNAGEEEDDLETTVITKQPTPTSPSSINNSNTTPKKSGLSTSSDSINNKMTPTKSISSMVGPNRPRVDSSPSGGKRRSQNNEMVTKVKDKISSDYKKMMEDPEAFRSEKLRQRKSKFFSKEELEEVVPFHPSSGTVLRSNLYKQFIEEKSMAIVENPEKYKSDLISNYHENLKLNTPPTAKKPSGGVGKLKAQPHRNRSHSQPTASTSGVGGGGGSNKNNQLIGTLEAIIEKENKRDGTSRKMPLLVSRCIEFLSNEEALKSEGLFRVAGNQGDVEDLLKSILLIGSIIPLDCSVHVVSNALKKFLRQLSIPLFTFKFHNDFIQTTKLDENGRIEGIKQILKQIPQPNQILIRELMKFLVKVTEHSSSNMMHSHNLGLMFGPTLMKSPEEGEFNVLSMMMDSASQVVTTILENYDKIYDDVNDTTVVDHQ